MLTFSTSSCENDSSRCTKFREVRLRATRFNDCPRVGVEAREKHQCAFVRGRSLHDNFMLVQCTVRRLHALKKPFVILKLDVSKAFDSIQWPFLVEVLRLIGFGTRWITWICGLLATSSIRTMVNGVPGETRFNCRGLRLGDPLSPMLCILITYNACLIWPLDGDPLSPRSKGIEPEAFNFCR